MRPLFENIPFPLTFKIYIFNITNPDDILNGNKPKLNEIGPYVFDEWKLREDLVDDDSKDTITFTLKQLFKFRPDLSNGLTGNEEVVVPNLVLLASTMTVKQEREAFLPTIIKAMHQIFGNVSSPFVRMRAMDYMFSGLEFNCSGTEFAAKVVCAAIRSEGIEQVWDGDECNRLRGTDSTIFPPFLEPDDGLWTYTPDICMSLKAHYVRKSSYAGLPTSLYSINFGNFEDDEKKLCFCDGTCPPKGTIDLLPCLGSRIYGSKPHFLDADESLLRAVEGLHPNRSEHDVIVNFEAISGTPLSGAKRLQFSLAMEAIEEYEMMSKLPTAQLPLVWIEEVIKWIGIVSSMIGLIISGFVFYNEHHNKVSVSSTANNATRAVEANGTSAKTLDDLIYLKNRVEEVQNSKNDEEN
ncbi:unnamed protein product [Chironomus riparius]|uniref:Sensory neuron membrane protein 1 n=1 Tax=Chironomus riparius TaxID=315576 RepID=A0A9N9S185_9DIPT|nr:unnamed protein product [Chironomus riparius]